MLGGQGLHFVGRGLREIADVDVRDAGELSLGLADRPAHHLDAIEAFCGGELQNLGQAQVGKNSGNKAELHAITPGGKIGERPRRKVRAQVRAQIMVIGRIFPRPRPACKPADERAEP